MITQAALRKLALTLEGVTEEPHFDMTSFRIGKKILITMREKATRICVKLTPEDQDLFSLHDKTVIYPVPNKWGKQGWTFIDLKKVRVSVLKDLLTAALEAIAKKPAKKR